MDGHSRKHLLAHLQRKSPDILRPYLIRSCEALKAPAMRPRLLPRRILPRCRPRHRDLHSVRQDSDHLDHGMEHEASKLVEETDKFGDPARTVTLRNVFGPDLDLQ
eukprot:747204-Hanusia_phi.AAC.1